MSAGERNPDHSLPMSCSDQIGSGKQGRPNVPSRIQKDPSQHCRCLAPLRKAIGWGGWVSHTCGSKEKALPLPSSPQSVALRCICMLATRFGETKNQIPPFCFLLLQSTACFRHASGEQGTCMRMRVRTPW